MIMILRSVVYAESPSGSVYPYGESHSKFLNIDCDGQMKVNQSKSKIEPALCIQLMKLKQRKDGATTLPAFNQRWLDATYVVQKSCHTISSA